MQKIRFFREKRRFGEVKWDFFGEKKWFFGEENKL